MAIPSLEEVYFIFCLISLNILRISCSGTKISMKFQFGIPTFYHFKYTISIFNFHFPIENSASFLFFLSDFIRSSRYVIFSRRRKFVCDRHDKYFPFFILQNCGFFISFVPDTKREEIGWKSRKSTEGDWKGKKRLENGSGSR